MAGIPGLPSDKTVQAVEIVADVFIGAHLLVVTLMVLNRLFVQFHIVKAYTTRSYIREFLVFLDWLGLVLHVVIDFGLLGKYVWMPTYAFLAPSEYAYFTKIGGLVVPVVDSFSLFLYKIILNLIFEDWINKEVLPKAYRLNIVSFWFNIISWVVFLVIVPLQCTPLRAYWTENPYLGAVSTACSHLLAVTMAQYVLHVVSDILGGPYPFVRNKQGWFLLFYMYIRFEAATVFLIGIFNTFSMLAILVMTIIWIQWPEKYTYAGRVARMLVGYSMTTTGLMIVCVAQVRVFLRWMAGKRGPRSSSTEMSGVVEMEALRENHDEMTRVASSSERSDGHPEIEEKKEKL